MNIRKMLGVAGVVTGVTLVGLIAHDRLGTNVDVDEDSFVVSNYDLLRGYKFIYEADPDGSEDLMFHKKNYIVRVGTDCNNTRVSIKMEGSGRFNPLAGMSMRPERFYRRDGTVTNEELGELLLRRIRKEYGKDIPFPKIKEKLER